MTFNSNAEEIRYYMKQLLNSGGEHTVDQIKTYVREKSGKDFSNGTYAGAMRDLIDRDPNYHIPRRGIYAAKNQHPASNNDVFTEIIQQALHAVEEACKVDISQYTVSELQALQVRSSKIKEALNHLLNEQ